MIPGKHMLTREGDDQEIHPVVIHATQVLQSN